MGHLLDITRGGIASLSVSVFEDGFSIDPEGGWGERKFNLYCHIMTTFNNEFKVYQMYKPMPL